MTILQEKLLEKYIDNCIETGMYTRRQIEAWNEETKKEAIAIQSNIDKGIKFNIVEGKTYNNARQGKLKIIQLGTKSVKVLFYESYNRKPQTITITIDELYRLCGGALA